MLARCYLLHHEERQSDEAEAIAEVLQGDSAPDDNQARGLIVGQERVGHKGQVEYQGQLEQALLQAFVGDVVAGEDAAHHEGGGAEGAVAEAYLLLAHAQSLHRPRCLEEEGHNLHHEALAEPVEDDEGDVVPDMAFLEEFREHSPQLSERLSDAFRVLGRLPC